MCSACVCSREVLVETRLPRGTYGGQLYVWLLVSLCGVQLAFANTDDYDDYNYNYSMCATDLATDKFVEENAVESSLGCVRGRVSGSIAGLATFQRWLEQRLPTSVGHPGVVASARLSLNAKYTPPCYSPIGQILVLAHPLGPTSWETMEVPFGAHKP